MKEVYSFLPALVTLLVLACSIAWLRQKGYAVSQLGSRRNTDSRLRSVATLRLSPQHSIYLVEVCGKAFVIAGAPGGCSISAVTTSDE